MAPENGRMLDWLGGLEPAWTLLGEESLNALMEEPSADNRTLRLAADLSEDELALSPVIRNASILLREIIGNDGLKLTATGNLSRAAVAAMGAAMTWPGHDPAEARRHSKVLNEPDVRELHFLRTLAETAGLVEQDRGKLRAAQQGRELAGSQGRALQAILFHLTFWHMNLAWFGRGMFDRWPQEQIGLVLWSLSVAADEWQAPETLVRLCTIPCDTVLEPEWDAGALILEARILRPLYWFGLVEHRGEDEGTGGETSMSHAWRKSALFDRFLSFEVRVEGAGAAWH